MPGHQRGKTLSPTQAEVRAQATMLGHQRGKTWTCCTDRTSVWQLGTLLEDTIPEYASIGCLDLGSCAW